MADAANLRGVIAAASLKHLMQQQLQQQNNSSPRRNRRGLIEALPIGASMLAARQSPRRNRRGLIEAERIQLQRQLWFHLRGVIAAASLKLDLCPLLPLVFLVISAA